MVKAFIESPSRYGAIYVEQTLEPKPPTDDMILGTWTHYKLLEPEKWDSLYVLGPKCDRRTKEGKAVWNEFQSTVNGREIIEQKDLPRVEIAEGMAEAIRQDDFAGKLLRKTSRREQGVLYRDPITGLLLKCRFDGLILNSKRPIVWDIKTSVKPGEGFADQAYRLKYHLQHALYSNAAKALLGMPCLFVFVVVGKSPPYPVHHYELDSEFAELGQAELREALCNLEIAYDTGNWRAEGQGVLTKIGPPKWAKRRYNGGVSSMLPVEV